MRWARRLDAPKSPSIFIWHDSPCGIFKYSERQGDINNPSDDDPQSLVRALKMFYDRRNELRPDQQRRLMRMLGQDPDMPFVTRPELDWEQFSKSHDFPKSLHERFLYHPPYRGA
jgi:hypothetical protein